MYTHKDWADVGELIVQQPGFVNIMSLESHLGQNNEDTQTDTCMIMNSYEFLYIAGSFSPFFLASPSIYPHSHTCRQYVPAPKPIQSM